MTQQFNKGDRIRATHKTGDDVHEFTNISWDDIPEGIYLRYHPDYWDFEVLAKPEPKKIGTVIEYTDKTQDNPVRAVKVSEDRWYYTPHGCTYFWDTLRDDMVGGFTVVSGDE